LTGKDNESEPLWNGVVMIIDIYRDLSRNPMGYFKGMPIAASLCICPCFQLVIVHTNGSILCSDAATLKAAIAWLMSDVPPTALF